MPSGDLHRAALLSDQLIRISGGTGTVSLLDHVKGEIRSRLPGGVPGVETIADSVGLQRWTLQRRLAHYGSSFSAVTDQVRRELAERLLRQRYVPVLEISNLLGYSELSAFSRAFRRWFGISPRQYRSRLLSPATDRSQPAHNPGIRQ
jgi:AraC-like DNA-binding protein